MSDVLPTRLGSNLVMKKAQIQLKVKAIEVPNDLLSAEKSSTFIVQAKGPIPVMKDIHPESFYHHNVHVKAVS